MRKKERQFKKWTKRYLHPVLCGMERAQTYSYVSKYTTESGYEVAEVYDDNHSIVNGFYTPEGQSYKRGNGLLNDIKRTRKYLDKLFASRKKVMLRVLPEYSRGILYMRVITNRVNQS